MPRRRQAEEFTVHAITLPVPLNQKARLLDPSGQLFVLKEEEEAVRANNARKVPLAIRANAGEDCVDILFKSELPDSRENAFFSKVNIHIHFAQFDIQGSDGVTTGFNYEQSIRPFATEGKPWWPRRPRAPPGCAWAEGSGSSPASWWGWGWTRTGLSRSSGCWK